MYRNECLQEYLIKYWPEKDPAAVKYMETPVDVTDQIVLDGLLPDTEYNFMVCLFKNRNQRFQMFDFVDFNAL